MGAASRTKGASFEREVGNALHEELGIRFERDLEQYRKSDRGDLIPRDPAFPFLIECKRRSKGFACETAWRRQATAAAQAAGKIPASSGRSGRAHPTVFFCPSFAILSPARAPEMGKLQHARDSRTP